MNADAPHYHGHRKRLREKFRKTGLAGFADYEVVELLLTLTIAMRDVKEPANRSSLASATCADALDAPLEELEQVKGIGSVTPVGLRIIREAASLYLQQSAELRDSFADPEALARFWRAQDRRATQ